MTKIILLIIDGFGIGEMFDVEKERPTDKGANTLLNTVKNCGFNLRLPTLEKLGLGNIVPSSAACPVSKPQASFGKAMLRHQGADTYAGHQELMGTMPVPPVKQLMKDIAADLKRYLEKKGFKVQFPLGDKPILLVDDKIVVHDNMEGEIAQNINITGSLDEKSFEAIEKVGLAVREFVKVGRVIVVCGRGFKVNNILDCVIERPNQIGVDTPKLGVYDENYRVRHLGHGVDESKQVPTIAYKSGIGVSLIGKAADVIQCDGAELFPIIDTDEVFDKTVTEYLHSNSRLIISNIQETDLAGHEQDPVRYGNLLLKIDKGIDKILNVIRSEDYLIITADHGNDPTIGHAKHTREMVPILLYSQQIKVREIGTRSTLADTGATISHLFNINPPESGHYYL